MPADVGSMCIYFFSSCVLLKGDGDEDEVLLYCSLDGVSNVIYLSNNNNILPEEANECVWEKMSVRDSGKNCAMFEES